MSWLEPLPDAARQRALDAWAIGELGIPGIELMERAGAGLARAVAARAPAGRVVVACGRGNNGGDGFVAARLLRERGREVTVLLLAEPSELRGDALASYRRLGDGVPFEAGALLGAAAIVDALLGTGSSGPPRGAIADAIAAIVDARARDGTVVVACDVPSGVDASTGEVPGVAVCADATVTFHAGKPGLWISPGKSHAGEVSVIDIGIPPGGPGDGVDPEVGLIEPAVLESIPRRGPASTKFTAGSVLVCGGSPGLTGAPCMAAMAAMRAGAGYVTVAAPRSLARVIEAKLLEVMTVALDDEDGALGPAAVPASLERAERLQSVILGPGLGRAAQTADFARAFAARVERGLVLDADGLNAFTGRLGDLGARGAATVLTPHAGELARLLETDSAEIGARRLAHARAAAEQASAVVVLKGDDTLVAEPGGRTGVSRGGAPALATAGTGDVLSGIAGAFLAKGMDPFAAACAAIFLHAEAARTLAAQAGVEGVVASDVIATLPRVLARGV